MAKARTPGAEGEREARQQKLPLAWQTAAATPAPPGPQAPEPATPPEAATAVAAASVAADQSGQSDRSDRPAVNGLPATMPARGPAQGTEPAGIAGQEADGANSGVAGGRTGEMLLSARVDSGFSIQEVANRTRIPRTIVEQLEGNAFDELPSEYHCLNHLNKLCELYNIDPEPLRARLRADLLAHRGEAEGIETLKAVSTDTGSGPMITYVLPGPTPAKGGWEHVTRLAVSGVTVLLVLIVLTALAVQHFRHRNGQEPKGTLPPQVGHTPPVDLKEFMAPKPLNAYELPIPAK
jgi:transcriptional regulator with XRE-family HTH domain